MTEIPPATRAAVTELLVRELRAAFDAALAAGVPQTALDKELQERTRRLAPPPA